MMGGQYHVLEGPLQHEQVVILRCLRGMVPQQPHELSSRACLVTQQAHPGSSAQLQQVQAVLKQLLLYCWLGDGLEGQHQ